MLVSLSLFVLVTGVWFAVFVLVIVGLFVFVVVVVTSVDAAESTNLIENIKHNRVAEPGSLSSGKMAMKIFAKRVITIFATNESFLRVIANMQI